MRAEISEIPRREPRLIEQVEEESPDNQEDVWY